MGEMPTLLLQALTLQTGYNSALVTLGTCFLGIAAGGAGTFVFLRRRSLISDAISHATLPGVGIAFIIMVLLGGDGRWLPGLLLGAAASAALGVVAVEAMVRHTRLTEDAAIGAVLSVFFGLGIVLLTVIQTLDRGRAAGLESFLLGSTAGMLFNEAVTVAIAAVIAAATILLLRRVMTLIAFDPAYATSLGLPVKRLDLLLMGLVLAITVIGLKVVGLILIVALLIIPPVTARLWTRRSDHLILLSSGFGAISGYVGTALSTLSANLPTGPIIVLTAFAVFLASFALAPERGLLAAYRRSRRYKHKVHQRQGLLAVARGDRILSARTRRILVADRLLRPDGVPTVLGEQRAEMVLRDEALWAAARATWIGDPAIDGHDGVTPADAVLTRDQLEILSGRLELVGGQDA